MSPGSPMELTQRTPMRGVLDLGCPGLSRGATSKPMPPANRTLRRVINESPVDARKSGHRTPIAGIERHQRVAAHGRTESYVNDWNAAVSLPRAIPALQSLRFLRSALSFEARCS